jgi:hypothetical protein
MFQISKETQKFLNDVGEDHQKLLTMIPPSADRMTPGNILIFRYYLGSGVGSKAQRIVLVVKCRRGDGVFPGLDSKLLSCFKLNGDSSAVIEAILENLYKKRRLASYYGKIKESLIKLLGIDSFRTYKLNSMKEIYKVTLGE